MKNILKLGAIVASLLVSVSAFAAGCASNVCNPCKTTCSLPAPRKECITITEDCEGTPRYEWHCTKRKLPCGGKRKVRQIQVTPICERVVVDGEEGAEEAEMAKPAKKSHNKKRFFAD